MAKFASLTALLAAAALLPAAAGAEALSGTLGPYPVVMEQDPSLPDHTVYRPADLKAVPGKLPMIAFGNGGCANVGSAFKALLGEVASHGYVVTAPGPITPPAPVAGQRPGQSKPKQMQTALSWAEAQTAKAGGVYQGRIDTSKLAVMGQSCGGLEAIQAGGDARVRTVLVLNSGIIRGGIPNADGTVREPSGYLPASAADLKNLHTPVLYLIGGPTDQAYRGAEGDFADIAGPPLFNANINLGHGGSWRQPHGGVMGKAAIDWLNWRLKGDAAASKTFAGADCGLCRDPQWTVKRKNFDGR